MNPVLMQTTFRAAARQGWSCGAAQGALDEPDGEDLIRLKIYRARMLLAMRYMQWRAQALTDEACWEGGGPHARQLLADEANLYLSHAQSIAAEIRSQDRTLLEDASVCAVVSTALVRVCLPESSGRLQIFELFCLSLYVSNPIKSNA